MGEKMPIHEFQCRKCGEAFEQIFSGPPVAIRCPVCGSKEAERLVSAFAARTSTQRRGGVVDLSSGCCPCAKGGAGRFHAH